MSDSRKNPGKKPAKLEHTNATTNLFENIPYKFAPSDYPYDYANISQNVGKISGEYLVVKLGSYLQFYNRNEKQPVVNPKVASPRIAERMNKFKAKAEEADTIGWKLHISVNPADIDAAWSIISKILIANKITAFKIITPALLGKSLQTKKINEISNKQFTIYQFRNASVKNEQWEAIIAEIEKALLANHIRPTTIPVANKQIADSQFFSYRNDTHPDKDIYISDQDAEKYANEKTTANPSYNLRGSEDPFKDMKPFLMMQTSPKQ